MSARHFADMAREHWLEIASKADDEAAVVRAEIDYESLYLRPEAERDLADLLGLPQSLGPLLGVIVYSPSRDLRERAVGALLRQLERHQSSVAA